MKLTEFNNKKQEIGVEGTGVTTTTTEKREWKSKETGEVTFTIPAGSKVHIHFTPKTLPGRIWVQFGDEVKMSSTALGFKWLKGFRKPPTLNTLYKQDSNGIVATPTGKRVEPDGYGPDGSPSWMLCLGLI